MNLYDIRIFKDGVHVDNKTVRAENEGRACSAAMMKTQVRFMGEEASFMGRLVKADGSREEWREFRGNH